MHGLQVRIGLEQGVAQPLLLERLDLHLVRGTDLRALIRGGSPDSRSEVSTSAKNRHCAWVAWNTFGPCAIHAASDLNVNRSMPDADIILSTGPNAMSCLSTIS